MVASITRKAYDESIIIIIIITLANLSRDVLCLCMIDTDRIDRHTWPVLATQAPQAPPVFHLCMLAACDDYRKEAVQIIPWHLQRQQQQQQQHYLVMGPALPQHLGLGLRLVVHRAVCLLLSRQQGWGM